MESKYTKNPETRKNMSANPMIVVFLPNFDESSMSSTWHVKWDPIIVVCLFVCLLIVVVVVVEPNDCCCRTKF